VSLTLQEWKEKQTASERAGKRWRKWLGRLTLTVTTAVCPLPLHPTKYTQSPGRSCGYKKYAFLFSPSTRQAVYLDSIVNVTNVFPS